MLFKRLTAVLILFFFLSHLHAQTADIKAKVEKLLGQMTLDEKIGQMTQVTLSVVAQGGWSNQDGSLDSAALKKAVLDYKVGSILNTTAHALSGRKMESRSNRNSG